MYKIKIDTIIISKAKKLYPLAQLGQAIESQIQTDITLSAGKTGETYSAKINGIKYNMTNKMCDFLNQLTKQYWSGNEIQVKNITLTISDDHKPSNPFLPIIDLMVKPIIKGK